MKEKVRRPKKRVAAVGNVGGEIVGDDGGGRGGGWDCYLQQMGICDESEWAK